MATSYTLEFEKPLAELEKQIDELKRVGSEREIDVLGELTTLEEKLDAKRAEIYAGLTPMQRVLVARHARRPYTLDYIGAIFEEHIELHGDRLFADDAALVAGPARLSHRIGLERRRPQIDRRQPVRVRATGQQAAISRGQVHSAGKGQACALGSTSRSKRSNRPTMWR